MTYVTVTLNKFEVMQGAYSGVLRHVDTQVNQQKEFYGADSMLDGWHTGIIGALGEMIIAKFHNVYWSGVGRKGAPDVNGLQVRTSKWKAGKLVLHDNDGDESKFWLVTTESVFRYRVYGWILGRDGKQKQFWADPTGKGRWAYFVPHSALNPPLSAPPAPIDDGAECLF